MDTFGTLIISYVTRDLAKKFQNRSGIIVTGMGLVLSGVFFSFSLRQRCSLRQRTSNTIMTQDVPGHSELPISGALPKA